MAGVKELDDVSSAIMCMDTLAMDSMDMRPEPLRNVKSPVVLTSKEGRNADSGAGERGQEDKDDVHETEDPVGTAPNSSEAKATGYDDDEGLMTDPGTPDTHGTPGSPGTLQEEFPEDAHELDKSKDMNVDMVDNDFEEETGYSDEGLMTDPGTPETRGSPQEEFAQDVDELDETNDINLDETENDLGEEKGSDVEVLDSDPGTPQEEALGDVNELDEIKDINVDGSEHDLEVLDVGEKSLDSERFVAPFPITRVKKIIKLDKDVRLVSSDAIALVAQATALFVQSLSSASFTVMLQTKRKTIRGPDVVLAAKSSRQFRECLGNDLATLLEESNVEIVNSEDELVEKEHGTGGEPIMKKPQQHKSAKKHQLASLGSRPITNFFKA
ncbi:hypothetical protein M758_8G064300 [Ceratodon purpureus]|nr:hypothetical protein M758_8G064300 [Ceratodon purpureus]